MLKFSALGLKGLGYVIYSTEQANYRRQDSQSVFIECFRPLIRDPPPQKKNRKRWKKQHGLSSLI
jgi:hypothetical protein